MDTTATDLFERYHVPVYRYFLRSIGLHDVAQDLTQELFLRVLRSLRTRSPEHERGWIFRIARTLAVDYRRTHPVRHVPLADLPPLRVQATQVIAFGLGEAIALLSDGERESFLLREIGGLSYSEIAGTCDTTVETVRSRLYQARCRLKTLLGARLAVDESNRRDQDA